MRIPGFFAVGLCLLAAGCATTPAVDRPAPVVAAVKPAPVAPTDCEWRRERDGFGASVVITSDPRWKVRRGAPMRAMPDPVRMSSVHVGSKVWALIFLTNPMPDKEGALNVTCDVRTIRPNGRVTLHRELRALRRKDVGHRAHLYLSEFVVTMSGEDGDPLGEWVLEIVVRDSNRGIEIPIVGRYTLLPRDRRVAGPGARVRN